ncbi:hypothetical protein Tco_0674660 [Tanacetum coccineum]
MDVRIYNGKSNILRMRSGSSSEVLRFCQIIARWWRGDVDWWCKAAVMWQQGWRGGGEVNGSDKGGFGDVEMVEVVSAVGDGGNDVGAVEMVVVVPRWQRLMEVVTRVVAIGGWPKVGRCDAEKDGGEGEDVCVCG